MIFIEEIINYLRKNTPYRYRLGGISKEELKTFSAAVVYTDTPMQCDGISETHQLTLRIIAQGKTEKTLKTIEKIKNDIHGVMLTVGDRSIGNILYAAQNGGGFLIDEESETTHQILYYDIIYERNE